MSSFLLRIKPTDPSAVCSVRYTMLLLKKVSGRKGSEIRIFPFSGILSSGRMVKRSNSVCTSVEFIYTIYKKKIKNDLLFLVITKNRPGSLEFLKFGVLRI
jgi:hypothetical protein